MPLRLSFSHKKAPQHGLTRAGGLFLGSRGISNVDVITKAIVDFIQEQGATPFLVPAMGSHGGATAEGQLEVLASYHITPESMGCEIRSSMEVVDLGVSDTGQPVLIDKYAYDSDGIIVSCKAALAGKWPGLIPRSEPEELFFDAYGTLTTPICSER